MRKGNNMWERVDTAMVVVNYTTLDEMKKYREAIRDSGLNVNNCELLAIVETKKEREILSHQSIAVFMSEQDFNFLGQLKNPAAQKALGRKYDMVLMLADPQRKTKKALRRTVRQLSVGVNSTDNEQDVNLQTEGKTPSHLINFAQQTLEKIA